MGRRFIGPLEAAWMIRLAKIRDQLVWTRTAPALFKPEYVEDLKEQEKRAMRFVAMHARTNS